MLGLWFGLLENFWLKLGLIEDLIDCFHLASTEGFSVEAEDSTKVQGSVALIQGTLSSVFASVVFKSEAVVVTYGIPSSIA